MSEYVVQWWHQGRWSAHGDARNEADAYEITASIEEQNTYWRILHYPNGIGNYPIELFDELTLEIGGRKYKAGEFEAWERAKRGGS